MKITEKIKTFEDACKQLGLNVEEIEKRFEHDTPDEIAYKKLKIIVKALNEGWIPDMKDFNILKYEVYRDWYQGGFSSYVCHVYRHTSVGSALLYKSRELANYAKEQFKDIYQQYFES